MALIGKIRKNSWLLVVMIALGLGGFILMDMTSGQQSIFGSNQTTLAEINGNKVDINQFTAVEQLRDQILYGNSAGDNFARRQALWDFFVEKYAVQDEADALGLGVGTDELVDLHFGMNLSPVISGRFSNPATGQVNRDQLNQFKQAIDENSLDPSFRQFWAHQEEEVIKERLKEKIVGMAAKGVYVPTWYAEMVGNDQNQRGDFLLVRVPFDQVDETQVTVSDEALAAFLKKNPAKYKVEDELREVSYLVFEVKPSAADSAKIRQDMADLMIKFENTVNDTLFVENNFGTIEGTYFKKPDVTPFTIADTVFSMPIGQVYGPFVDGPTYKAVKLLDRKVIPDSVRSRHILLRADPTNQLQVNQTFRTIDSLKNLIEAGTHTFDSLATQFGQDGTAAKGGDLGFAGPGQMVKPFNDLIFYQAEIGKLYVVGTQFGVHLVEVMDRKYINNEEGVRLAFISKPILPSKETTDAVEERAIEISEGNPSLDQLIQIASQNPDLKLETARALKENDFTIPALGSGQTSRSIIRWAFGNDPQVSDPSVGDVSPEIYVYQDPIQYYTNKFVLAALKGIRKPGTPKVADIRTQLETDYVLHAKGELLAEQLKGRTNLSEVASSFGTQVDTARNVTLFSGFLPSAGAEPEVVAAAFKLSVGQVSEPLVGNGGVYLMQPLSLPTSGAAPNIPAVRRQVMTTLQAQVRSRLANTLRENADVEDNRSRFY